MTYYEQDVYQLRHGDTRLERVRKLSRDLQDALQRLREAKRLVLEFHVMSMEEFLQNIRHTHGYHADRESAAVQKQYDAYRDVAAKKEDELRLGLEQARTKAGEAARALRREADDVRLWLQRLDNHLEEIQRAASHSNQALTLTGQQLSVDAVAALHRELHSTTWFRDSFS